MKTALHINTVRVRKDFPILSRKIHGKPLVYLDNAATTQKPLQVIDAVVNFYTQHNANIHRGLHTLSEEATLLYEEAHGVVANFIHAIPEEIIFTRNTTESINLVAYAWGEENIRKGDEVVISQLEHHSNFVPWQQLCIRKQAKFIILPLTSDGMLDMKKARSLISKRTRLVAIAHVSNVLGTILPIKEVAALAHKVGALILVDGAQSAPHMPINVKDLDADFFAFSAHKMLGPTGIGVLYAKQAFLEKMRPFLYGGGMINEVHNVRSTWNELPWKFEAGTPNVAGGVGFAAAIRYLEKVGMGNILKHEQELVGYTLSLLKKNPGITIYGPKRIESRGGVISFNVRGIHSHDLSTLLDHEGIAIRGGHHCAMPLMEMMHLPSTSRASFYSYNTKEECDALAEGIKKAQKVFA